MKNEITLIYVVYGKSCPISYKSLMAFYRYAIKDYYFKDGEWIGAGVKGKKEDLLDLFRKIKFFEIEQ